jgi:hypothetical protein
MGFRLPKKEGGLSVWSLVDKARAFTSMWVVKFLQERTNPVLQATIQAVTNWYADEMDPAIGSMVHKPLDNGEVWHLDKRACYALTQGDNLNSPNVIKPLLYVMYIWSLGLSVNTQGPLDHLERGDTQGQPNALKREP